MKANEKSKEKTKTQKTNVLSQNRQEHGQGKTRLRQEHRQARQRQRAKETHKYI